MKTKWYNYIKMDGSPFTGRRPLVQLVAGGSDQASGQDSRGWRSGQGAQKLAASCKQLKRCWEHLGNLRFSKLFMVDSGG